MLAMRVPAPDLAPALPQEEDRVVVIRFGHDWEESCMQMDEVLRCWPTCVLPHVLWAAQPHSPHCSCHRHGASDFMSGPALPQTEGGFAAAQVLSSTADPMKNFAVIYLVDIGEVPDFNTMYEVSHPACLPQCGLACSWLCVGAEQLSPVRHAA